MALLSRHPEHGSAPPPLILGGSRVHPLRWVAGTIVLLAAGFALALIGHARPAYDAEGWMVWANQTLHGSLNLDGAPSWKPLSFIFTLPYGLTGHRAEMWLWTITACAGGIAAPLVAGHLAYRLTPRAASPLPPWLAPALAALVAAGITATMTVSAKTTPVHMGLLRQILITSSDPLALALWLGAWDCLLARRHGAALGLLWFAGLGRPEVWVFLGLYGLWLWWREPRRRAILILAGLALPLAWFLAPALCSRSWLSAGNFDLRLATAVHGSKFIGVPDRVRTLTGPVIQIEVAVAMLIAVVRRDRGTLLLLGGAALWTAIEIGFALHGFSAVARYLIEAGGLLAVVGGVGVGALVAAPSRIGRGGPAARGVRLGAHGAALAAIVVLGIALIPFARASVRGTHVVVTNQHANQRQLDALTRLVRRVGGPRRIRACGAPDVTVGWQSGVAWELNLNVGNVGIRPVSRITRPTTLFSRHHDGWILHVLHAAAGAPAYCRQLDGVSS